MHLKPRFKSFFNPNFFQGAMRIPHNNQQTNSRRRCHTRVHRLLCGWDPSRNLEWCFGLVEKPKTLLLHTDSSPCFSCFCIIKHLPSVAPDNTSVSPWERASYVFVCNIYHLSPAWQIQNFFHTFLTLVSHSWCLLIHSRRRQRTTPPPVDDTEAKQIPYDKNVHSDQIRSFFGLRFLHFLNFESPEDVEK